MEETREPEEKQGKEPVDEVTRRISEIYRSSQIPEERKDEMIAELLAAGEEAPGIPAPLLTGAFLASFFLPPAGVFFAFHFFLRHEERGRLPGAVCLCLTVAALLLFRFALLRFSGD